MLPNIQCACLGTEECEHHPVEKENFAQDIPRLTVNFCQALTGDYTPVNKPLVPLTLGSSGCSKIYHYYIF